MKEVVLIREADDPLLYLERLAYLEALRGAVARLEGARITLAQALQRIREGVGARGHSSPPHPRPSVVAP
jgi:hypothetical protein